MAEFSFVSGKILGQITELEKISNELKKSYIRVENVSKNLCNFSGEVDKGIREAIKGCLNEIDQQKKTTDAMRKCLYNVTKCYEDTEKKICSQEKSDSSILDALKPFITKSGNTFGANASAEVSNENGTKTAKANAEAYVAKGSIDGGIGDFLLRYGASGAILSANASASASATANKDTIEASAQANAKASLASGEAYAGALGGLIKYKAQGTVCGAQAYAQASASLMHNGVPIPSIGLSANAKASVADGNISGTAGLDKYNVHGKAEGYVVGAEASAKAEVGMMQEKGESPEQSKTVYGAKAEASAGAYLAKGKVTGGFDLFGIKIDASVGGSVGAGAEVKAKATSDSIELGAGLAALLGVNADIKVDWSNFGFDLDFGF